MADHTDPDPVRPRRRRRSREDVVERIRDAARRLFAERGYAATTTREIARLADVSETLVFRHFDDKAKLFEAVVTDPFRALMDDFVQRYPDPTAPGFRETVPRQFTRDVHELFERNEALFRALLAGPSSPGVEAAPALHGLDAFFAQSVDQVRRRYDKAGEQPPFDLAIAVRLEFGMIAASVLLRDSLFAGAAPDRAALVGALEAIVEQSLGGPPLD